ncbi:TPA: ASCH domain-containing protein [Enterococcus faecalis]|jgi:predicted transcriptional regulator|uniref:ASCH domain-containing protein n=1 Tax=Enterococcus sp. DIV0086 TaxID=2774655 RepID=UPI0029876082|nr:ASCH domain-containing protein [Enterococcus faecalis]HBI1662534.1 ASCH domain-containing protein [Enterococcus faecalis]HBI1677697.1 ASCH domain-containing protein [Enterococcus faecalis]HBI1678249.1 ASCH domain-containing protein [Enterococcus faecalis]HBI1686285.1 ASCH domain-containing protein [Enterococcus faecalis]
MKVLLSIKPEFVEEIMEGRKKFEYRKNIFKRDDISSIVVYATKPYGKVVGEFEIESIIKDRPSNIWKETKQYSGISRKFFNEYFDGRDTGFAIQIKEFIKYDVPMDLNYFDKKIKVAPQSFCYIEG